MKIISAILMVVAYLGILYSLITEDVLRMVFFGIMLIDLKLSDLKD